MDLIHCHMSFVKIKYPLIGRSAVMGQPGEVYNLTDDFEKGDKYILYYDDKVLCFS